MTQEHLLYPALLFVTIASAVLGYWLGSGSLLRARLCAAIACALLVGGAVLNYRAGWLPEVFLTRLTGLLEGSWFPPFAAALMAIGTAQARHSIRQGTMKPDDGRVSIAFYSLVGIGALTAAFYALYARIDSPPHGLSDLEESMIDTDNVVRQTTDYTCGPSACATLLRLRGLDPLATEASMLVPCMTKRGGGATTLGMAIGLKSVTGRRVRIAYPTFDELTRYPLPLVAAVTTPAGVDHALVVREIRPDGVLLADPINGLFLQDIQIFKQRFLGEVLVLD